MSHTTAVITGKVVKYAGRRETLVLYRDALRTARKFKGLTTKEGKPWDEELKKNIRQEFEEAKFETDPEIIARMLMVGRDCLMNIQEKIAQPFGSVGSDKVLQYKLEQSVPPPAVNERERRERRVISRHHLDDE